MTITLTREEAQQVLDALQCATPPTFSAKIVEDWQSAVEFLRARLSAPEPEPVAWQSRMRPDWEENGWTQWKDCPKEQADNFWKTPRLHDWVYEVRALYTAPPQREWQGLTDEERESIASKAGYNPLTMTVYEYRVIIQKETEAKLREKNGNL